MSAYPLHVKDVAVAVVSALVSMFGVAVNIFAAITLLFNPVRRNAFSIFCFSHITTSLGALLVCLLEEEPSTLINKILGQIVTLLFYVTSYSHLALSINRLIAVALPLKGASILTRKKSLCTVIMVWILGLSQTIPHFWRASCYVYYESGQWRWKLAETTCGKITSYFNKTDILLILATLILDCITVLRLRKQNKITNPQNATVPNNMQQKKRRLEIRLFKQTLCQNGLFLIVVVSFQLLPMIDNRWLGFLTATLWQLYHVFDGLIIMIFHFQSSLLKTFLKKLFQRNDQQ
ncbi:unnamed protein product [Cylicocyclus nassatus]|uniref:G-protein coupled receptors family 1 profile domain-containing protein n=1 Tax=Cylicocyclus nassatus TaxID=53992 RepID=A0AA36GZM6_CYLNA|nr:unnamed protein product [Cylicocyclus nassatus]